VDASTIRVAAVTISDTRGIDNDESGTCLCERLQRAGFTVALQRIIRDEPDDLRALVAEVCDRDLADAIVTTGGTGIAPRDQTFEAVDCLLEKRIDGNKWAHERCCPAPPQAYTVAASSLPFPAIRVPSSLRSTRSWLLSCPTQ
jgi:molybdenum cofactor synthesis domain-containing protein